MSLQQAIQATERTLVDVREIHEFEMGHAPGAINIPLSVIQGKVDDILSYSTPVVLYCRSGMRSGQALEFLKAMGAKDIYNGGGLEDVLALMNG